MLFLCGLLAAGGLYGQSFVLGIDVDDPPEGVFFEEWSEMFLNGNKIGYSHSSLERRGDTIVTLTTTNLLMGRGETLLQSTTVSETREAIDGSPRSITVVETVGERTETRRVRFTGDGAVVTTTAGGRTWDHEVSLEPGFVVSWGFVRELEALGEPETGDRIVSRLFSPDITVNQALPVTTVFGPEEMVAFRGTPMRARRIEQTIQVGFLPLSVTLRVDSGGRLLRGSIPVGGMDIEVIGATEEQATADFQSTDLFSSTLIPLDREIPFGAESVVYEMVVAGETDIDVPDSSNQHVTRSGRGAEQQTPDTENQWTVRVRRGTLPSQAGDLSAADPVYLEASSLVDFHDPLIRELLPEGINEMDFGEKVRTLVRVTDEGIAEKTMDIGFASASETARTRSGDCTEHALLLAALARAAGVPARGASGLVGFSEENGDPMMGYHMWTQVWDGRQWLDIDAAFGEAETSPVRILLDTSDLSDPDFLEEALVIAELIGRTQVRITAVNEGTKTP